jgi:Zn-dependent M28 family amino/carboxypeptidase
MRRTHLVACAAAIAAVAAPAAQAKPADVNSNRLERMVTVDGIVEHQQALQNIADMTGGTRHTETPGYMASVRYVVDRMERAGLNVSITNFNMPEWQETAPPVFEQLAPTAKTYKPGTAADDDSAAVDYITFEFSPTKDVTAAVVPTTDIVIPSPAANSNTSGCEAADFPAATTGAISLIQRGTCPFVQKLANAQAAGALGVILFNEGDSAGRMNAGFRSGPTDLNIPAVFSSFAVGNELYQAFKAGQSPRVHLKTSGVNVDRFFPQVIAETKKGDPNHIVLAGAHLDSVTAGPGINDDGSGTAWQLELAEQLAKPGTPPRNKIRFMWFGGEEDGLVGSQYYAARLSQAEVDKIDVMIDTDMIASPNYVRLVYDGDGDELGPAGPPGSGVVENVFKRYFHQRGMATLPQAFDGRSDYVGFINRGIPGGGIFAGAEVPKTAEQAAVFGGVVGEQYDPCYHEACDNIDTVTGQPPADTMNVYEANPTPANLAIAQQQANSLNGNALKSLREMSGAVTHAVWYFARHKDPFGDRAPTSATMHKAARTMVKRSARFKYRGHHRARTR